MEALTEAFIAHSALTGAYVLSLHADNERIDDGLSVDELEEGLASPELLEDDPDDPVARVVWFWVMQEVCHFAQFVA